MNYWFLYNDNGVVQITICEDDVWNYLPEGLKTLKIKEDDLTENEIDCLINIEKYTVLNNKVVLK